MSVEVEVVDGSAFKEALHSVRSDNTSDTYVIVGHVDGDQNRINVVTVGQDNNEIASYMDDCQMMYVLARYETKFDMSLTIKFVYFRWIGDKVPIQKKGRFGVVKGSVEKHFNPYHMLLEISSVEDFNTEKILHQLEETSGTKSKVIETTEGRQERGFTQTQLPKRNQGAKFGVNEISKTGANLEIDPGVREYISLVQDNEDPTSWLLACYQDNNPKMPIIVAGKGEGTVDELRENLVDDQVMYGLYRVTDKIDDITTVKFVYIIWVGTKVKPMTRAKISTHRGTMDELFGPAHVNIFANELSDITEELVLEKVTFASGTRSHVK
ncbi:uncharacterized protein LOC126808659 [Patella vulgata]|uniref:uncharacterized protein LOC126808659 n=1 Tax=Patella vulgata TaxID=6465 RepID=UPI00217F74FB|nr:uncharacterized protein LOC126808659 [Patella vulgata]XP_050389535.1 uncharacterized protein LOC126808659 [Patella vulgata]XP_050389536.1 uncharacterized protein LOC126808659 [Patella vulgata]XP_050389537.1 uncharacterized protein LOC126808659 [Patella vulgata]XP_050389538.1 uncharacterized protein LOC126808659 [Patella vulgata]XP_050389539.1 uncharacterized protein LOC126808659 [Patella vulgata]